jgi:hypothetical protein
MTTGPFSLERLMPGHYCFSNLEQKDKAAFAESIFKRRNIPWKEIKNLPRHGLGIEKISKSSLKTTLPKNITEDFKYFLAFRFSGKKPMVGYRVHEIFYVLWFDHDFTLYEHSFCATNKSCR